MTTNYFKNMIAGNIFNVGSQPDFPTQFYLGLSSTAPNESGTGATEPSASGSGYARVQLTDLTGPTNGVVTTTENITFPKALTDWFPASSPAIVYTIWDGAGSGAHLLASVDLDQSRIVQANTYLTFPAGEISISVV